MVVRKAMIFLEIVCREALASAKEVSFWETCMGVEPPVKASGTRS